MRARGGFISVAGAVTDLPGINQRLDGIEATR